MMIATRTPFRITLGGGGTDLPSFYSRHGGFILALGIDKYMYVLLNRPSVGRKIILHYTQSEAVENLDQLKHELAREALRSGGIRERVEISSLADIPASTGLGSSSCYLVGLLAALNAELGKTVSRQELAEEACRIELEVLRKGIGKQDQYMAAFGGLTALEIAKDGKVSVKSVPLPPEASQALVANMHLYDLDRRRDALEVLKDQDQAMRVKRDDSSRVEDGLLGILETGRKILKAVEGRDFDAYGRLLDEHWQNKRRLSSKISFPEVDALYEQAKKDYGVLGGKIAGAGGGGFLMLYCHRNHAELESFMKSRGYSRMKYGIEPSGVQTLVSGAPQGGRA
jgi:D-glycero-alpha-D-manno-heptose-7-phosphate kinase